MNGQYDGIIYPTRKDFNWNYDIKKGENDAGIFIDYNKA